MGKTSRGNNHLECGQATLHPLFIFMLLIFSFCWLLAYLPCFQVSFEETFISEQGGVKLTKV